MTTRNKAMLIEYHRKLPKEKNIMRNMRSRRRNRKCHSCETKVHRSRLYNALPEIKLGRGDNVTTH